MTLLWYFFSSLALAAQPVVTFTDTVLELGLAADQTSHEISFQKHAAIYRAKKSLSPCLENSARKNTPVTLEVDSEKLEILSCKAAKTP